MKRLMIAAAVVLALPVGAALAQAPAAQAPAAPKPAPAPVAPAPALLPIKVFMRNVINPAAEGYWALSGIEEDSDGAKNRAPRDDAHWAKELENAAAIQEAGNMLLADGRRIEDPVWIKNANKLIVGGQQGIKAVMAKDENATFDAGSTMYEACYDCHAKYVIRPKNSLYGRDQEIPKPDGDTHSLR
jgi:hypothetical protein